jgi:hypothetical protein
MAFFQVFIELTNGSIIRMLQDKLFWPSDFQPEHQALDCWNDKVDSRRTFGRELLLEEVKMLEKSSDLQEDIKFFCIETKSADVCLLWAI